MGRWGSKKGPKHDLSPYPPTLPTPPTPPTPPTAPPIPLCVTKKPSPRQRGFKIIQNDYLVSENSASITSSAPPVPPPPGGVESPPSAPAC